MSIKEGRSGKRWLSFRVTLSRPTTVQVSVRLTTANGTARAGQDYVAKTQVIRFVPGQTAGAFAVAVLGDRRKERWETFRVVQSDAVRSVAGAAATGTIKDDD